MKNILSELRYLRETADYRASRTIDAEVAITACIMASTLFDRLGIKK